MTALADAIVQSSVRLAQTGGLDGWSLERVAQGARCAKGLVVHHYKTRANLLQTTGAWIGRVRLDRRVAALDSGGTEALDQLWQVITDDHRTGLTRAAFALAAHQFPTRHPDDAAKLHRSIAKALEVPADALAEPVAVMAMLEGVEFQLLRQVDPQRVKRAYDRLWVTLIDG